MFEIEFYATVCDLKDYPDIQPIVTKLKIYEGVRYPKEIAQNASSENNSLILKSRRLILREIFLIDKLEQQNRACRMLHQNCVNEISFK